MTTAAAGPPALPGVQLWTVDAELRRDFGGTLRRLAEIGYRRVEAAGWYGRTPAAFRAACDAAGLVCDSAHVALAELVAEPQRVIDAAGVIGLRYVVAPSPLPPAGGAMSRDDWRRTAAALERAGEAMTAAGLLFAYHNHRDEFADHGGRLGFDEILATPPRHVRLELDVGWATVAGEDPAALIRRHGERVMLLHAKDVTAAGGFAELGRGVIDWPAVFRAARQAGVRGWYVEQDPPHARPVLESLAISLAALRRLGA